MKKINITKVMIVGLISLIFLFSGTLTTNAASKTKPILTHQRPNDKSDWHQAIVIKTTVIYKTKNNMHFKKDLKLNPGQKIYMNMNVPTNGDTPFMIAIKSPKHNKINPRYHWTSSNITSFKILNNTHQ